MLPRALEVGRQFEFREGQVVLVLNQPLELAELFEDAMQACCLRPRIDPAQCRHHRFLVIGLLVFEVDFGAERSGEIGGQIARILRADGDTGAEGPALTGEVFEVLAGPHAPRLVQHEQARELAGLRTVYQYAMQPDDDEFGQRGLDIVCR